MVFQKQTWATDLGSKFCQSFWAFRLGILVYDLCKILTQKQCSGCCASALRLQESVNTFSSVCASGKLLTFKPVHTVGWTLAHIPLFISLQRDRIPKISGHLSWSFWTSPGHLSERLAQVSRSSWAMRYNHPLLDGRQQTSATSLLAQVNIPVSIF